MNPPSSANPGDTLALPLCEALLAFTRGNYAECVESLVRVRHIARRCGGSLAQCDFVHLTLTEAALHARRTALPACWWPSAQHRSQQVDSINGCKDGWEWQRPNTVEPKTRCMTLGIRL